MVKTWISEMTRTSLLFGTTMADKASGRLVAEAQVRIVCVDANGKIKRIPKELQERAG